MTSNERRSKGRTVNDSSNAVVREERSALLAMRARVPDHVVHRAFAHETVLLNLQTGRYHGVNRTGARMFKVLQGSETLQQAAAQLAQEYELPLNTLEDDVCDFCVDLRDRELIEITDERVR